MHQLGTTPVDSTFREFARIPEQIIAKSKDE
jgi:hypothetical protein